MSARFGLLVDFGSTFTKVRVVDLASGSLRASAQSPSTVELDINEGLELALADVPQRFRTPGPDVFAAASSSAAGGLRIIAVGLVADLTARAASTAALSAGGKVVGVYANGLMSDDLAEIVALAPDLLLLAGGTDGGDRACITGNAELLASSALACPIVVAGNRNASEDVATLLRRGDKDHVVVPNVLPSLDRIEAAAVTEAIRELFMCRITQAKGLARAEARIGRVSMPTPQAVLRGVQLLSDGSNEIPGWGDIVCVDVGGATTDVYSVAEGRPVDRGTVVRGLPEPVTKRTVEADLGMRVSAGTVLQAMDRTDMAELEARGIDVGPTVAGLVRETSRLPTNTAGSSIDHLLGRTAVRTAVRRHVGSVELAYGPHGEFFVQRGKDLRDVRLVIGTGGVLRSSPPSTTASILSAAAFDDDHPLTLAPRQPRLFVDREYVLYAAGLLAELDAPVAMRLLEGTIGAIEAV